MAGCTDCADDLSLLNHLIGFDENLSVVGIGGLHAVAMIDDHQLAITTGVGGP